MTLQQVALGHGWRVQRQAQVRTTFGRGDYTVHVRRDRWRKTTARAYRGNALTAVLRGRKAVEEYLAGVV